MRCEKMLSAVTVEIGLSRLCSVDRLSLPLYKTHLWQAVRFFKSENIYLRKNVSPIASAKDFIAKQTVNEQEGNQHINHLLETSDIPDLTIIHERRGIVLC